MDDIGDIDSYAMHHQSFLAFLCSVLLLILHLRRSTLFYKLSASLTAGIMRIRDRFSSFSSEHCCCWHCSNTYARCELLCHALITTTVTFFASGIPLASSISIFLSFSSISPIAFRKSGWQQVWTVVTQYAHDALPDNVGVVFSAERKHFGLSITRGYHCMSVANHHGGINDGVVLVSNPTWISLPFLSDPLCALVLGVTKSMQQFFIFTFFV